MTNKFERILFILHRRRALLISVAMPYLQYLTKTRRNFLLHGFIVHEENGLWRGRFVVLLHFDKVFWGNFGGHVQGTY